MQFNPNARLDVFGLGNALVDTLVFVEDGFLESLGLVKGVMTLADGETQARILGRLADRKLELRSGGSAANTVWTVARSGGRAAYTGVVSDDPNGEFYKKDLEENGVEFEVLPLPENEGPTGTCIVLTTPDAERTMSTHLGVSVQMQKDKLDVKRLHESRLLYIEGYLWDEESAKETCLFALQEAQAAGVRTAFSFSDPFCVGRFRDEFEMLAREKCDMVFCNAEELSALSGESDLAKASSFLGKLVELAFVTDGAEGCLVIEGDKVERVSGFPVTAVDTNGAGDTFAGGVLYALSRGESPHRAARWGNYLASQIVGIHGARLQSDYREHYEKIMES